MSKMDDVYFDREQRDALRDPPDRVISTMHRIVTGDVPRHENGNIPIAWLREQWQSLVEALFE